MKPSRGRLLLLFILFAAAVFAKEPYGWSVSVGKNDPYVDEAVVVTYTCRFEDTGVLYTIDFRPLEETEAYRLFILAQKEEITEGRRVNVFRYVLFPKQPGMLKLSFEALMRRTTRASIENTVIGRDNVEDVDFSDIGVKLPVAAMQVKENNATLTGSFALFMETDKAEVRAYEPLHLSVKVEGSGNLDELLPFEIKIPGVQIFSEPPEKSYTLGENGFSGEWVQRFALVAKKSFGLKALGLRTFDPDQQREKQLSTPETTVSVTPGPEPATLLDTAEPEETAWKWEWSYFYYLLSFISGAVLGRWLRFSPSARQNANTVVARVESAKSGKMLATTLVLSGDERFRELIEKLENHPESISLEQAKKEALERLKV